jgi:hypothetical protein
MSEWIACVVCGASTRRLSDDDAEDPAVACPCCRRHYPSSLIKAVYDDFQYAVKLKTGEIIVFSRAEISGNYARLMGRPEAYTSYQSHARYPIGRGTDVRVSDIVWCEDLG